MNLKKYSFISTTLASLLIIGTVWLTPLSYAQEVESNGAAPTETSQNSSQEQGSGQGSDQGLNQGENQGVNQGADQGAGQGAVDSNSSAVSNGETSAGSNDQQAPLTQSPTNSEIQGVNQGTNQGADQGTNQGVGQNDPSATNTGTGTNSDNSSTVDTNNSSTNNSNNSSSQNNNSAGTATSGQSSASENTGPGSVTTGNADISIEQVVSDNFNTSGSTGDIQHNVTPGDHNGDLVLSFNSSNDPALTNSFRSVNTITGSDSNNNATVNSNRTNLNEIQNDGTINNSLTAGAITGQNQAVQNTGNASVLTGNANVAATLINFLNSNVVDGNLLIDVTDIFGDLNGNIVIPEEVVAYLERQQRLLMGIDASNEGTGSNSDNNATVNVNDTSNTNLNNNADVNNDVDINAVTGQNEATQNTGGSTIDTGDVQTTTNTVTLANANVTDGNLGIIIINALNKWMSFILGKDGKLTPIDHDYSTIQASNTGTGSDSNNNATIDVNNSDTTNISNNANIDNEIDLTAITGQNVANQNTGNAQVITGDARVNANVVNIVNTNVVRGNLVVAVINVFGNWLGDLIFGGQVVNEAPAGSVVVNAENSNTGSGTNNEVNVNVDSENNLAINNRADINNNLNVNADTGNNEADRNTGLANVHTGDALAVLHARNIANVTLAGISSPWMNITSNLVNATTGVNSTNTINTNINDQRRLTILNDADVNTAIGAVANTGFNTTNRNTLGGIVTTGSSRIDALIENLLNQTWLIGSAYGDDPNYGIDVDGGNVVTGAGSDNSTETNVDIEGNANIDNDADVDNSINANSNTGFNEANENTGGGEVYTGSADIGGGIDNNVNQVEVSGNIGPWDIEVNNDADITNTINAIATTGGNQTERNTGCVSCDDPVVPPPVTPSVEKVVEEEGIEGVGGGEIVEEEALNPSVGGAAFEKTASEIPLKFPTAGGTKSSKSFDASLFGLLAVVGGTALTMLSGVRRKLTIGRK